MRKVLAKINFGNRRLLDDISDATHLVSSVIRKGHDSAAQKIIQLSNPFSKNYAHNTKADNIFQKYLNQILQ